MDPPVTLTAHMENCDGWELLSTVSRKDNGSPHPHHRKNEPSSSFPIVLEVKTMASLGFCKSHCRSPFLSDIPGLRKLTKARCGSSHHSNLIMPRRMYRLVVRGCSGENQPEEKKKAERQTFLTLEEAGLVEVSGLSTHERFLCRLTVTCSIHSLK